jgi:hypothetical protein
MRRTTMLVVCSLALIFCAGSAFALTTPPADTLKIEYFANANTAGAPDATVRLTNPGTAPANVCADIFVFDPDQELTECCSCLLSPDGLRTLSVNTDITGNPLTGVSLQTGVIKIVSAKLSNGTCPLPTVINSTPALRAWATHIQDSTFAITETAAQDATFSSGELSRLVSECQAINLDGSGKGVCSCGTGD